MTDLIWIGNTLYPRWLVMDVAIFVATICIACVLLVAAALEKDSTNVR